MPRYHNSPPARENLQELCRSRRKSFSLNSPLWNESIAFFIFVLLSPLWIPVYLVRLPFIIRGNYLKKKYPPPVPNIPAEPEPPPDPELIRRRELAKRTNKQKHPRIRFLYDPINDDPTYAWAIKEAGDRASEEVGQQFVMGTCHRIWNRKKEILKEEFGIDWYSPREMNPGARFD